MWINFKPANTNQLRVYEEADVDEEDVMDGELLQGTSALQDVAVWSTASSPSVSISIDSILPLQFSSSTLLATAAESASCRVCYNISGETEYREKKTNLVGKTIRSKKYHISQPIL